MVEVTTSERADAHRPAAGYEALSTGQGTPQVHVHYVHRDIFGNGIAIRSYGEIKIAAGEYVWAKELLMNTLQVLVLTPEIGTNNALGYMAQKAIWHKSEYDNYASIDIYDHNGVFQSPSVGRVDGSIWLNFIALGE